MIELNEEQRTAIETNNGAAVRVVDPIANREYVLVRADVYAQMSAIIDGYTKRAGWDDPALDVYESYRKPQ